MARWRCPGGAIKGHLCYSPGCHLHVDNSAHHRNLTDACLMSKIHLALLRDLKCPPVLAICYFLEPGERMVLC